MILYVFIKWHRIITPVMRKKYWFISSREVLLYSNHLLNNTNHGWPQLSLLLPGRGHQLLEDRRTTSNRRWTPVLVDCPHHPQFIASYNKDIENSSLLYSF